MPISDIPNRLKLKSTAITNSGTQQPAPHAVLCTDTRTFQIRQVQTSNTVFVVQPTEKPLPSNGAEEPATRLCAIAQCPSLLELVPTSSSSSAFLRQNLPEYDGDQSHTDGSPPTRSTARLEPWDKASKFGILEDAPFSAREYEQAWQDLCVFEHGSASWIPTPSISASAWDAVVVAASVRGLKLDESFPISPMFSTVEELHLPEPLVEAVLARVSARDQDGQDGYIKLDRGKCVSWVGAVLLQSFGGERLISDFIRQWKDKLPEAWREHASLEAIKVGLGRWSLRRFPLTASRESIHKLRAQQLYITRKDRQGT